MMDKHTANWIRLMQWCAKYWGCHQLPDRSFFVAGYQFPICARCTGIFIGYIISFMYSFIHKKLSLFLIIILITPMAIDGGIQYFTRYISNNIKRFVTGILAGFGFIQLVKLLLLLTKDNFTSF